MGSAAWRAERKVAMEARTEAVSVLYRHPRSSSHTSLLFKIQVSSVKTCGLIAATPLMVYLSLPIRLAPSAWAVILLISKDLTITDPSRLTKRVPTHINTPTVSFLWPLPFLRMGRYMWLLLGT